jgi:hypothetical protein
VLDGPRNAPPNHAADQIAMSKHVVCVVEGFRAGFRPMSAKQTVRDAVDIRVGMMCHPARLDDNKLPAG